MTGIVSYGAYVPYYRMPRSVVAKAWGQGGGSGEKAVARYDEDPVSMSVAAGMDCLNGIDPKSVDGLFMATTSAPYKERLNATIAATALDLGRQVRNADFANSLKAGTTALLSAADAVEAGSLGQVLVTASDIRMGAASGQNEQLFGDGAAALLLGHENVIAEIEGSYTLADDLVDAWRAHDEVFVRNWEERFGLDEGYRKIPGEAATGVMEKLGLSAKDISKLCFYGPNSRRHGEVSRSMGFEQEQVQDPLLDTVGNTGVALALMILVGALEEASAGDRILMVSWGNGSDAIIFKVTDNISAIKNKRGIKGHLAIKKELDSYEKYLRWRGLIQLEAAARPGQPPTSMSSLWREHNSALPLRGVKCTSCGTPQLYMSGSSTRARICLNCHARDEFESYRFAEKTGKVASFSHDFLALSADPPNTISVIDFEGGGRGAFETTDYIPEECEVGMEVEMTFRKIFFDKGVHNYYWKCKPLRD